MPLLLPSRVCACGGGRAGGQTGARRARRRARSRGRAARCCGTRSPAEPFPLGRPVVRGPLQGTRGTPRQPDRTFVQHLSFLRTLYFTLFTTTTTTKSFSLSLLRHSLPTGEPFLRMQAEFLWRFTWNGHGVITLPDFLFRRAECICRKCCHLCERSEHFQREPDLLFRYKGGFDAQRICCSLLFPF